MRSGTHLAVQLLELGVVFVHLKVELCAGDRYHAGGGDPRGDQLRLGADVHRT